MTDKTIAFSLLDLAPIPEGSSAREAFSHSLDLARLAEKRGYHRYWLAEHHNMTGIASAATSVLIGYLAANTTTLHLGSGGVMLPNHSPLVIAEQFGTLNTLYPGRIDLGLGRAPGSDQRTMMALRRHMSGDIDNFPRDVAELVDWFDARDPNPHVRPVPGYGEKIPVWLLGSSLYSAQLAAQLGLPFAFASHFAPDMLFQALHLYRSNFKPSARLEKPYAMVCINIIAADSNRDAEFLFTSMQQAFVKLRRGETGQLPPPIQNMDQFWSPSEQYGVQQALSMSLVGDKAKLQHYAATTPIVDMVRFSPAQLDAEALINLLRPLTPRLYSIASSQAEVENEVHVTVGVVRYDVEGRARAGGASSFLADRVEEEGEVRVFIEHNDNFRLPTNPETPVIMIGPGTGIAPFRAFMQQRAADEAPGKNWLFFGNPHFTEDFLYQVEWQRYVKEGVLTRIDLAWSRDQKEKIYVQDKLREQGAELWRWINDGAHIYVCGDANRMAKDVEQALLEVIAEFGGMDTEAADEFLSELRVERRYQRDVY